MQSMNTVMKALRQTVSRGREVLVHRDWSRPPRLRLWIGGDRSHDRRRRPSPCRGTGGLPKRAPVRLRGQFHRDSRADVDQGIGD